MQASLFDSYPVDSTKIKRGIVRITGKGKPLSKSQQAFNRLTARIAALKKEIEKANENLRGLQNVYEKEVRPEITTLGRSKIEMAHLLHEKRAKVKLTKNMKSDLDDLIYELLDDAFYAVEPSDNDKTLYNLYNDVSFEEEAKQQQADMSEMFADILFQQTGFTIDPAMLNNGLPDFEKIQAHFEEQLKEREKAGKGKSTRKKNQRTSDKEAREKQKEELKQKSIRSIYLSLAKILHPDTETDENIRVEKEEYMKQVTAAYNNKNLPELLELEIQWVNKYDNQLADTPENTLQLYNELLKDQVESLKDELYFMAQNPAYSNIIHLSKVPLNWAMQELSKEKKSYKKAHKEFVKYNKKLQKEANSKIVILECIDIFLQKEEDDFDDWDGFNDFISEW
ncbi:MAG: hypothetical protein IT249_11330 [Chitinophagaceae bacterium]|nr:hypothetical protein [Chitinophagaceae bacterium]